MSDLTQPRGISAELAGLVETSFQFAGASKAESTLRQYASAWKAFASFCLVHHLSALPATVQTVTVYLTALATEGKSVPTVTGHLAAIRHYHDASRVSFDWNDPILGQVMDGIRRKMGRPSKGADALLASDVAKLAETCDNTLSGLRDRALILLGMSGAFRRSEIASLTVENFSVQEGEGALFRLQRSKTDQTGQGEDIAVPFARDPDMCAVRAVLAWLTTSGVESGPIFRRIFKGGKVGNESLSGEAIRLILAERVEAAGLSGRISPHSLRAGFCTQAALMGTDLQRISQHARHKNPKTTMGYIRVADRFRKNAVAGMF